jgi:CDP-6-deoxy-D-xylo-4-hexulose-3-dehydrase
MKYELTSHEFDEEDIKNIILLFDSKQLTMGKKVKEFERKLADYHNRKYAVMTNSGSSANLIMIASLVTSGLLKKSDKVLVPAVSWSTTYFPLAQYGLIPIFVDVDPHTFSLKVKDVQLAMDHHHDIKCVLNVPLLGYYADSAAIEKFCASRNMLYLEDCCEAFGSSFAGVRAGSVGIASTLSFFYSHQLPAIEGGCVLLDDKNLYDHALSLRAHGWTREIEEPTLLPVEDDPFLRAFRFVLPGYCLRPTEINAVLADRRLDLWSNSERVRRSNHETFIKLFSSMPFLKPQSWHDGISAFGFGIILNSNINRAKLVEKLCENNISTRPIVAGNFLRNPAINYFEHGVSGSLTNADIIDSQGLFFGNHAQDLRQNLHKLSDILNEILK